MFSIVSRLSIRMHSEEFKNTILPLQGSLYRFALSFLGNGPEAEDCVQEIFLKLWIKRESLSSIQNMKAFALQMTRNFCLDKLKSRKPMVDSAELTRMESSADPHQSVEFLDTMAWMHRAMNTLPEQQRSLLHLRNIEELEMKEIADVTGMTIEHVRVTLSRARIAIRQLYEKQFGHD